jgi:Kef-type K+ transport system membrane component KefB
MVPSEIVYTILLFGLFVVPRALQRFRIPAAITSLVLGMAAGPGLGLFASDETVKLLSTFGIVALFLFAGLDVDVDDLRRERRIITEHLVVQVVALFLSAFAVAALIGVAFRPALIVALAVLTPSTGFILDSLPGMGLDERTAFWVRTKAIATELVALAVMFVTLQSASLRELSVSSVALVAMVVVLPILFRAFAHFIVPHAPKTEFSFLLMTAVICALVTRQLGVYYLVGAFIVGMVAQSFRSGLPAIANERMLGAVEAFASIFVPFYFFHAGLVLRREDLSLDALVYGLAFLVAALPIRIGMVVLHRRVRLGEALRDSLRVAVPMLPTLVFTLVLAGILRERFPMPPGVFGGLIIYALVNTMIPSLALRTPLPEFETPEILPLPNRSPAADG